MEVKASIMERSAKAAIRDLSTDGVAVAELLKLEPSEVTLQRAADTKRRQKEYLDAQIQQEGRALVSPEPRRGTYGTLESGTVTVRVDGDLRA